MIRQIKQNKCKAQIRTKHSAEPTKICYLHAEKARGTRASFVSRDVAAIILILLHCCPAGNTARTGEPTSPATKSAELNDVVRLWRSELKEKTEDCCA